MATSSGALVERGYAGATAHGFGADSLPAGQLLGLVKRNVYLVLTAGLAEREARRRELAEILQALRPTETIVLYSELSQSEQTLLERILHDGRLEEAAAMPADKDLLVGEAKAQRYSLRKDLKHAGYALVPGAGIVLIALLVNPSIVAEGWPLFAILGLGLFAGTLTTLDRPPSATGK